MGNNGQIDCVFSILKCTVVIFYEWNVCQIGRNSGIALPAKAINYITGDQRETWNLPDSMILPVSSIR